MVGTTLVFMLALLTLGAFFVGWPAAIVYRFLTGVSPPSTPAPGQPWSIGDALWFVCYRVGTGHFLAWRPRRYVPWTFFDMLVVALPIAALMVGPVLIAEPPKPAAKPAPLTVERSRTAVVLDVAIKGTLMVLAIGYLMIRAKATLHDFGWFRSGFVEDLFIGAATFAMVAPPVYALQALLVWRLNWKYEHPLIEMMQQTPDVLLFVLLTLSACVMAPLSEEWLFRGFIQGWLQRGMAWLMGVPTSPAGPPLPLAAVDPPVAALPAPLIHEPVVQASLAGPYPVIDLNPFPAGAQVSLPALGTAPAGPPELEQPFPRSLIVHGIPILLSATLFGLAHYGHGPAPIPLTLLALALGYVYQRRHSLVPVMLVHALFNGFSMLIFYVQLYELKQPLP